jgi:8-oxo-dGTP diphosphatase
MDARRDEETFLANYDPAAFPPVAVTADVVAFTIRDEELCVLLVRRARPPYEGFWALPGSFLRAGAVSKASETLEAAAARALAAKTGLAADAGPAAIDAHNSATRVHLEQLRTYGDPGRDPRMTVVSVAYMALAPSLPDPVAGTGTSEATWVAVSNLGLPETVAAGEPVAQIPDAGGVEFPLAFDHARIIFDARERARAKLEYSALATAFVGETFTLSALRGVYEIVWNQRLHASNFARKVLSAPGFVVSTGQTSSHGGRDGGRRAALYCSGGEVLLQPAILRSRP